MHKHQFGIDESESFKQFEINPRLQRTQVSGNDAGITFGNKFPEYPIVQVDTIVLKNRAVPPNLKNAGGKRRVPRFDQPSLQGVPKRV